MGIFIEENHKIIIAPEIKLVPKIADLIARDKSKDKRDSFKELSYVYFVTDYKSPYYIYPRDERRQRVKIELGFDPDWNPDQLLEDVAFVYDEMQKTPSISTLVAIRESLMTSTKVIEALRSRIEDRLIKFNTPSEVEDAPDELEDITNIVAAVSSLLVLADKLPKAISTMTDLEEKVKKEQSDDRKIRGGGSINAFEN